MSLPTRGRIARFELNGASRITKTACGLLLGTIWCLGATSPAQAQSIAGGFDDGFSAFADNGSQLANPSIAVGSGHIVAAVTGEIAWYSKNQVRLGSVPLGGPDGIWEPVGGTSSIDQPVILWDSIGSRYYASAVEHTPAGNDFLYIAYSQTADPADGWYTWQLDLSNLGSNIDRPTVGSSATGLVTTIQMAGSGDTCWLVWTSRSDLEQGSNASTHWRWVTTGKPLAAAVSDGSMGDAVYMLSSAVGSNSKLRIRSIRDPASYSTTLDGWLSASLQHIPPPADQPEMLGSINISDTQFQSTVLKNGSLWAVHNVNATDAPRDHSIVRWYEIDLGGWPLTGNSFSIVQQGDIDLGPGVSAFFPDIAVDDAGNAVIVFNVSSSNQPIAIARAVRFADDPAGEFQNPVVIRSSQTNNTTGLWGAYVGVEADPNEPGVFWSHAPYHEGGWRTWIGKVTLDNAGEPEGPFLRNPDLGDLRGEISTFNWDPYSLAISYRLVISFNPHFKGLVYDSGVISGTQHEVPAGILSCNTQYYWRVEAVTNQETMQSPETRWFRYMLNEDVNSDGIVDSADLGMLLSVYGSSEPAGDFNSDGRVDAADIGILIGAFGDTCN